MNWLIEVEELMINNDDVEKKMENMKYFVNIFFMIDLFYNMIICKDYEIELLFEWIVSHLKENLIILTFILMILLWFYLLIFEFKFKYNLLIDYDYVLLKNLIKI